MISVIALVFAVGGTAIAAKHYLIDSTKQISPKVLKKLRGRTGPRGPSDVYEAFTNDPAEPQVLRLSVPAGSYSVVAKAVAASGTSGSDTGGAGCILSGPGDNDYSVNKMPPSTVAAFSNALVATLKQPGQFSYECNGSGGTTAYEGFYQVRIVATRVAKVH